MCSFYAYVYVFYDFTFCLNVLFSLFCKHVRLFSCVVLNKLTYLLTVLYGTHDRDRQTNPQTTLYSI